MDNIKELSLKNKVVEDDIIMKVFTSDKFFDALENIQKRDQERQKSFMKRAEDLISKSRELSDRLRKQYGLDK